MRSVGAPADFVIISIHGFEQGRAAQGLRRLDDCRDVFG